MTTNNSNLYRVNARVNKLLQDLSKELGISIELERPKVAGGRYTAVIIARDDDAARATFETYARLCGVEAAMFNGKVMINGEVFVVAGLNPNKPKNCVQLTRVKDGKSFQCSAEVATRGFNALNPKAA